MEEAVTTQWQRIEAYLQKHAPTSQRLFLNPGASEEEIVEAETALGIPHFPDDFRASLKRHNGQATDEVLVGMGPLLSTQEIVTQWRIWKELLDAGTFVDDDAGSSPNAGVKANWWNEHWIPITHDGGGDHDCIDMDPGEGGSVGQIIEMWHDDADRPLKAPSFLSWLTACASGLEDGRFAWEEGSGFVPKEDV